MGKIDIINVEKFYGSYHALREVSLSIEEGEFMVLVGPSGCGKSTLLRSIAGLEDISGGVISVNDQPINDLSPQERNIAMVFQNYALYPHLTVKDNLAFSLKIHKFDKAEIEKRIANAAEMLGLTDYLSRRPRALSGGQRQRVAMGRAMVREPTAFLFDEPLSNLDARLRVEMRSEIRNLQRTLGTTAVYVTHDQVEAMTMGDRIAVVNQGGLEQVGTPLDLYRDPNNMFVAGFIGSPPMNFITAQASGGVATLKDGQQIMLPVRAEGEIKIGLRPEHIFLDKQEHHHSLNCSESRHFDLGSSLQFFFDLCGEEIEVSASRDVRTHTKAEVNIHFDPADLLVFGPDTNRIR
ncbi:ABC transporter ATP-binding protein [Planktotalea sp.]|uniref:ABC transporter ATP-binding protein n=1 Tax=Planktotalea sp. TaxID=2029877 RepID=UPI003D6C18FB